LIWLYYYCNINSIAGLTATQLQGCIENQSHAQSARPVKPSVTLPVAASARDLYAMATGHWARQLIASEEIRQA
jgi:hypothetical protein